MYQRLSDHILLGDSLRQRDPENFYLNGCGCAIGGAMLSVGAWSSGDPLPWRDTFQRFKIWPWLANRSPDGATFSAEIGDLFRAVCRGEITIEALTQQVRAWEDLYDDQLRADLAAEEVSAKEEAREEEVREEVSL